MRIIALLPDPPLPFGNAAARWYYVLVKGLTERGHEVTTFAPLANETERREIHERFPSPAFDVRLHPREKTRLGPFSSFRSAARPNSFMFSRRLVADLNATLGGGFDVLHVEQHWSGWLTLDHADRTLLSVQYLMKLDVAGIRPRSIMERRDRAVGYLGERRVIRSYKYLRACSPRLAGALHELHPKAEIATGPFALDATLYPFIEDDKRGGDPVVTLIGSMNWPPSLTAGRRLITRLWPEIKRRVPSARLAIVGWNAREALAEYLETPDVTVISDVYDARPYFENASVLLYAPGQGSGMKIKVQEAMAYGLPVVTTTEGVEGLPAVDGVHAGVCDDDAGLIDRTVALLEDRGRQDRQRHEARRLIETACAPGPTLDALEAVYRRMSDAAR